MKNIHRIYKVHFTTEILILMALFSGYIKNFILIFTIVSIHELGHIFVLRHFEYEITSVTIYPFGGITKVNKPINTPLKQEMIIAIAGVTMQLLFILLMYLLKEWSIIRLSTYQLFHFYNKTILFFNLLPIIPLDGSILLHSILEYFSSYKKALHRYLSFTLLILFV